MEVIRKIGASICIVSVVTVIFTMIIPENKSEKAIRFIVGLFFLVSVAALIFKSDFKLNIKFDIDKIKNSSNTVEAATENALKNLIEKNLSNKLSEVLMQNNIKAEKIQISVNITEENSISINSIVLYIKKEDEGLRSTILSIVKQHTEIVPVIEFI